jgi:heme/copper-type cytochrome/quinol oxidase subunit 3
MVMVMEMMMMTIPMKSSSMTVTMAMFSSLREGISPADFSLPESFSLSVVFRPAEAAENSLDGSVGLRVSG